jgi:hypothetical protein
MRSHPERQLRPTVLGTPREVVIMKRTSCWVAVALAATVGCGSQGNPNEENFPGAPGSSVPAPSTASGSSDSSGTGGSLPGSYPGMQKAEEPPKDKAKTEEAKPADETKAQPKAEEAAPNKDDSKEVAPKGDAPAPKEAAPK